MTDDDVIAKAIEWEIARVALRCFAMGAVFGFIIGAAIYG